MVLFRGLRAALFLCILGSSVLGVAGRPAENTFEDVTDSAGIQWRHFNGESPDRLLIEATAGGVGFVDFDSDGLLDLFFVNGGETPKGKSQTPVRHGLYRNLGKGRFEDVAAKAGVATTPMSLIATGRTTRCR